MKGSRYYVFEIKSSQTSYVLAVFGLPLEKIPSSPCTSFGFPSIFFFSLLLESRQQQLFHS